MGWVSQVRHAIERFRRTWSRTQHWRDRLMKLLGIVLLLVVIAWVADFGRSVTMPDVEGMNVHKAAKELNDAGIPFEAEGMYGIVITQSPRAGDPWYRWVDPTLTYEYLGEELQITGR